MKHILITGATGNVGFEVIKALAASGQVSNVFAGVRDTRKAAPFFSEYAVQFLKFDFLDPATYKPALENCGVLFLLRPPQISDVNNFFKPIIDTAKQCQVDHIIFLSVQGVENSSYIPHYKIEKLIRESGITYTFLRPAYFMQNFTTTLRKDLLEKNEIFLPAGKAKFTLIDTVDIGKVSARVLAAPAAFLNQAYDLTNDEKLTFQQMADTLSSQTSRTIRYTSPNLLRFFLQKRKEHVPVMFILVMIMLHYFPRFQQEPATSEWVHKITGGEPVSFASFVAREKSLLM